MRYSFIIPVYNRPEEVDELLNSLTRQTNKNFEVLIVEDGSSVPCKEVVDNYADRLDICYYFKSNSGPGQTRNYGAERGHGEYLIILDSDCILPEGYLAAVESELQRQKADAFGGPDRAHDSFTNIQKAINYAMTSFFTTGGIRGGKKKMDKFNIEEYIKQNPKLIFKTIQFSKLIIHGKPNGTNEHLDKLNILHLKGEADLYIDVNFLRIDSTQTDFLKKELYLIYDSPSQIPISVDVNIPSGNYTLIEEIEPTPISEEKAKAIAKPISWISGGIGALIGGKFGGTLGSTFGGRLGKFIGSSVGMVSGAASAATAGYVYTKEFFMGLELTNNDLEEKESIIQASKSLIALEIMGGNMLSEPDYDSKLQKYYQAECERQIKEIMKSFGWQEVYVKFNYK